MAYWGWRPFMLCVFISVWVTGCSERGTPPPSTSPTKLPALTLTVRLPDQTAHLSTPAYPLLSTQAQPTIEPVIAPTNSLIGLPPPTCYEMMTGGVLCLGTIANTQAAWLTQTAVLVEILAQDGTIIAGEEVTPEQRLIPPHTDAPYRALFTENTMAQRFGGVSVTFKRGETTTANPRRAAVEIAAQQGELVEDRYVFQARLQNTSTETIGPVRAVVTVLDNDDRVLAYRLWEAEMIEAGETTSIVLSLRPQITDGDLRHTLHVELN